MYFNARFLVLAREARKQTQAELAHATGLSQALLSRIENGLRTPSEAEIAILSTALDFPPSLFEQRDQEVPMPLTFYRKRSRLSKKDQHQLHARMNLAALHVARLLRSSEIGGELELMQLDPVEVGSAEGVARQLRSVWFIPRGPIANLVDVIERAGILVIPARLESRYLDGLSWWPPGLPPLILLNTAAPTDRQRFTLAHELGHIVMHHRRPLDQSSDPEAEANEFAAEFLMPAADILAHLHGRVDLARLAALKPIWRVSIQALLSRAKALKVIGDRYSQYLWTQLGSLGYRTREPAELDLSAEPPNLLRELFQHHLGELGYSVGDLEQLLHAHWPEIRRLYLDGDAVGLRLVS